MFDKRTALHRVEQQIAWRGQLFSVLRPKLNEFNEKSDELEKALEIKGIFHNGSANHITVVIADSGQVQEKNTPYILTTYFNGSQVKKDNRVIINGVPYKVTGVNNINEYSIISDISLEVILDGSIV